MAPGVPVHTARVEAPEPRHFAFLLMGESNMVGCGRLEEGVDDKEHPRVIVAECDLNHGFPRPHNLRFYMSFKNENPQLKWKMAREPLGSNEGTASSNEQDHEPAADGVGPGFACGRALADMMPSDCIVGLVPLATRSSTDLSGWAKDGDPYNRALQTVQLAESGEGGSKIPFTLAGVIWHHGESDARSSTAAAAYEARLEQLISDFRVDLNAPELPWIMGELGTFLDANAYPHRQQVVDATRRISRRVSHVEFVPSDGLMPLSTKSPYFSTASARELGFRFALSLCRLQPYLRAGSMQEPRCVEDEVDEVADISKNPEDRRDHRGTFFRAVGGLFDTLKDKHLPAV